MTAVDETSENAETASTDETSAPARSGRRRGGRGKRTAAQSSADETPTEQTDTKPITAEEIGEAATDVAPPALLEPTATSEVSVSSVTEATTEATGEDEPEFLTFGGSERPSRRGVGPKRRRPKLSFSEIAAADGDESVLAAPAADLPMNSAQIAKTMLGFDLDEDAIGTMEGVAPPESIGKLYVAPPEQPAGEMSMPSSEAATSDDDESDETDSDDTGTETEATRSKRRSRNRRRKRGRGVPTVETTSSDDESAPATGEMTDGPTSDAHYVEDLTALASPEPTAPAPAADPLADRYRDVADAYANGYEPPTLSQSAPPAGRPPVAIGPPVIAPESYRGGGGRDRDRSGRHDGRRSGGREPQQQQQPAPPSEIEQLIAQANELSRSSSRSQRRPLSTAANALKRLLELFLYELSGSRRTALIEYAEFLAAQDRGDSLQTELPAILDALRSLGDDSNASFEQILADLDQIERNRLD